ncbi:MAG: sugar ABC transporter ATP-binding protein [Chloroflexota bacterium]
MIKIHNVSKKFPGVVALDRVDFEIYGGEVVALVGENGAGKSTLMKILAGVYEPDDGQIWLNGDLIDLHDPHHARELGISIIYQEFCLTPNQSAWENIFLGREVHRGGGLGWLRFNDRAHMRAEAVKLLEQLGARFPVDELVRNLSVAEQQMVEIAKALGEEAKIIIMDEPTSALGPEEVDILFDVVRSLKARGIAVIFITHRLEEVFRIADRVIIFRDGSRVGSMPIGEATTVDKIISFMVGRELDRTLVHEVKSVREDVVLEVQCLTRHEVLHDISFTVARGEILGIAGLAGAGRTELVRAIFGADPIDAGQILIEGKPSVIASPAVAVRAGVALLPENRQRQGLVLIQSVQNNIALPTLDALARGKFVSRAAMRSQAQHYIDALRIRTPDMDKRTLELSGGNQQKVVVAKWLATGPKVLLLDEPTRGIDVGAKAEIYAIMNELVRQGVGIIMVSSEMPEILAMSDRILVMHEGRITGILERAEATQEKIMALASGLVMQS